MKEEKYTNRIEGYCRCGCKTKIIKFENSNLSIFKHNHRFTTENDIHKCTNIFRCSSCKDMIENSFLPLQESAKLETEITPETFTINDMYVESKLLFDCQDKLNDLQIENKQLKERIESINEYLDNRISDSDFVIKNRKRDNLEYENIMEYKQCYQNVKEFIKNQK